jgi:hypothetical protein
MPRSIIERSFPGAGRHSAAGLKVVAQKSCGVLRAMGPAIQRVHGDVTGGTIDRVSIAPDEKMVRERARKGGFTADQVPEVQATIGPTPSEQRALREEPG